MAYKINDGGIVRDATEVEIEMLESRTGSPELTDKEIVEILIGGGA